MSNKALPLIELAIEQAAELSTRAFCPTGPGGGRDNSCSPNGGKSTPDFGSMTSKDIVAHLQKSLAKLTKARADLQAVRDQVREKIAARVEAGEDYDDVTDEMIEEEMEATMPLYDVIEEANESIMKVLTLPDHRQSGIRIAPGSNLSTDQKEFVTQYAKHVDKLLDRDVLASANTGRPNMVPVRMEKGVRANHDGRGIVLGKLNSDDFFMSWVIILSYLREHRTPLLRF